ncbi:glycoside hydrolase family 2 protein [Gemmiger formicilis]|uniref:glycoside hydrolase family 2 protein n=1 Tax=Gemmiger formicilis TaxID=745368 RepID=UPI00195BF82D|nr:glycoside hydrolase family 2 TIM barrel-domain containing protein [Gemmiger formicilis]MBM6899728.1 glycoside hydrolase family 2 protein [Gemmiger formicilis]
MSETIVLNTGWTFTKEEHSEPVTLPHTWNAVDGQDGGNDYYRGSCTYALQLPAIRLPEGGRAVLQFDGVAMTAVVNLNGQKVAEHKGGYSTFRVDITDVLQDTNNLTVEVDNSDNDTVYPQKADFTFYGGIYRDVTLHILPAAHFAMEENGAVPVKVTPVVTDLETRRCEVTVEALVVDADRVRFSLDGQEMSAPVENGTAKAVFTLENARLWNGLDDPYLYTVTASLDNGETQSARFGCRKFEIDPQKGFFLNGRFYPLRGVSRHQDRKGVGVAITKEMMEEDLALILEMGANTIRLAHYQHAQAFYDLCDEKGLVIWAEIPYITMHMHNGRANTLTQMEELIVQNYNHPCIAVWGLSNEITAASPVNEELLENHRALNDLAHRLDPTRPTTMANVFMLEITSPILEIPDVNSYNLYFGWYLGELDQNDDFFDEYHAKYPDRCIGFSEYGADANPAYQTSHPERGDYTETYQCVYHEHMAKMIAERPWLWATHVWNMFDFAADGRDEGGKNGENQKGLVTFDRKIKKDAFYLYKAYWSKEAFVHTCGSRYVDRAEDVTEVKVYSNLPEVALYVDGRLQETKQGDKVFTFRVPITGKHSIEARAGGYSSVILVNRVDTPNPNYAMANRREVTNWFDGELDESCWSVKDNMAAAMADAKVGPILKQIGDKAAASRGDVAAAVKDNPALVAMMQRAMQRMTIEGMLRQAGTDIEDIKQLNRVLQGISKE